MVLHCWHMAIHWSGMLSSGWNDYGTYMGIQCDVSRRYSENGRDWIKHSHYSLWHAVEQAGRSDPTAIIFEF